MQIFTSLSTLCIFFFVIFLPSLNSFLLDSPQIFRSKAEHHALTNAINFSTQSGKPWYSSNELKRDRSLVLQNPHEIAASSSSKFILIEKGVGMYHRLEDRGDPRSTVEPLYLSYQEVIELLGEDKINKLIDGKDEELVIWVGNGDGKDYFALYTIEDLFSSSKVATSLGDDNVSTAGLREFGGRLVHRLDAAILASCNGLVEFHKSHMFCSRCGAKTKSDKVGACRRCINCGASTYPRIDIATIMLITSPCEQYALLGRKSSWPEGRYSTLAGFCEVGETLEECCSREVFEESGVIIDTSSIRFVFSQPWPFPRSLMVGFRGVAEADKGLPEIILDEKELQSVQWFHKKFVKEHLKGGSTALNFIPNEKEQEFHIPGSDSLARLLITQWAEESG